MDEQSYTKSIKLVRPEDYEPLVGAATVERILRKAEALRNRHVVHVSSTLYGGGVAELLSSLTILMNGAGVQTGWRVIQGRPDFFGITKKFHNALQGGEIDLTESQMEIYEDVVAENAFRTHLDQDFVVVHDPQPLPLIDHYRKRGPWVWRCHVDLSHPNRLLWAYLSSFVEKYDAAILSIPEYSRSLTTPQVYFMPATDPFNSKNQELSEDEIDARLALYDIPTDKPLVVQISRFDRWKDPQGVIDAFKIARKEVEATLVLVGNMAVDDPEGQEIYDHLREQKDERILILSCEDSTLVNALQSRADVVVQKSIREGFGLTVTEAMWKGRAVIGGNVGGIRYQIEDGKSGFLVNSVGETAERMVQLIKDEKLRREIGAAARERVRENFLMTRLMEQYLDLFQGFNTTYQLNSVGINRPRPPGQ